MWKLSHSNGSEEKNTVTFTKLVDNDLYTYVFLTFYLPKTIYK